MRSNGAGCANSNEQYKWCVQARRGIWLYLLLLIFEGALRKWFAPHQLTGAIAIIRDPLVLMVYYCAFRSGKCIDREFFLIATLSALMILLATFQVVLGVTTLPIAIFGLRSYLLHLPLIFVMRRLVTAKDVKNIGQFFLVSSIPMSMLMIAQFRAPSTSLLNAGTGEDFTQIRSAFGHVRAAGTFSFVTGVTEFFPIVQAFLIAEALKRRSQFKKLLGPALLATLLAIPFSGSRTLLLFSSFVAASALLAVGLNPKLVGRLVAIAGVAAIVGFISSRSATFGESLAVLQARWDEGKGDQEAAAMLGDRLLQPILTALGEAGRASLIGEGIGMGSNFASSQQTGTSGFLLAENEFIKVIQEDGAFIGSLFLIYKTRVAIRLLYSAYQAKRRTLLPLVLAAATLPNLIFNSMEQPTNLGFMVFGAGLAYASIEGARRRRLGLPDHYNRGWEQIQFNNATPQI